MLLISLLLFACKLDAAPSTASPVVAAATGTPEITVQTPGETAASTPQNNLNPPIAAPTEALPSLLAAYIKDSDLWTWSRLGARRITTSGGAYDLRFSPDGLSIAYTRRVDESRLEIWVVDLADGVERRLIGVDALDAMAEDVRDPNAIGVIPQQIEWLPDRRILAFNTAQIYEGPGISPLEDLQMVNVDSGERWALLQPGEGGNFYYSPDGAQIAIVSPTNIRLMNANAGDQRNVLDYDLVATYSEYPYYAEPVWSADGGFLRVALPPPNPLAVPAEATRLYQLPIDGSAGYQIGTVFSVPFFDTPVAFSPDLNDLIYLYESGDTGDNRRDLRIMRSDRSGEVVYHNGVGLRFMGWGPPSDAGAGDSGHFAYYLAPTSQEEARLYIGSRDAPPAVFAPSPYRVYHIQWIDGRHFLYLSEEGGSFGLYLASLDGENTLIDVLPDFPPAVDFINP